MTREQIGFIGTCLMGHGLAKDTVEQAYPLSVTAIATAPRWTT